MISCHQEPNIANATFGWFNISTSISIKGRVMCNFSIQISYNGRPHAPYCLQSQLPSPGATTTQSFDDIPKFQKENSSLSTSQKKSWGLNK